MQAALLLGIIYLAFISLGLPDSVLGVAWPSMRVSLGQPLESAGLITLVLTICSALSSLASGRLLARFGTGPVVAASGLLTGLALLGFSFSPSLGMVMLLALPLGLGAGAVDAGLNHHVARHYSSRHMNWLHGCWGVGATLGPLIMGWALAGTAGWALGYRVIAGIQLLLAALFLLTLRQWPKDEPSALAEGSTDSAAHQRPDSVLASWLAPTLYLLYAAVEISAGLWAASLLISTRGMSPATAGLWVSGFFGAIMAGRFATGLIARRLGNRLLVRGGLIMALAGTALLSLPALPDVLALGGLMLLGLGCAPIFPSLMHETAQRFSPGMASRVIGRQVSFAYLGAATVPAAMGYVAAQAGLGIVMPCLLLALLFLLALSELLNRMT
jgi:fucose permease